ncbi:MAG: hypothetical protein EBT84_11080 [Sphingomonadaceae bacterium]|nr:hypothetical protein [Sphingomonadaceae bacterium]
MKINLVNLLVTAAIGMVLLDGAAAQRVMLITPEEASASQAAGGLIAPRSAPQPGAPQISLVSPDVSKPVGAPTPIELRFLVTPPAEVRPETFRVLYGAFRIDITQRLLGVAKVTKDGISVGEAVLPSGRHQLALMITDSLGRETQSVVSFSVK